ncbi:MAG TPA: alpha/beta fold hydrolase [Mycobacterium sp.]|nr:alpha/beta fold hydrolase [Mycobacterium sp.]
MTDMRYVEVNGDRIAYYDEGVGETLLLVHGMAGSSQTWRELMPRLVTDYRVIAPDLLGHGASDKPHSDYSLGGYAVWLRDFMDTVGVPRATVVGQSLGGGIAMQFAYQHRARCERLILIDSSGLEPELNLALRMLSAPGAELLLPMVSPAPVRDVGQRIGSLIAAAGLRSPAGAELWNGISSMTDSGTRQAFLRTLRSVGDYRGQAVSAMNQPHLAAQLPVQLIWGERDWVVPVSHGYAAHEAMPGSRLTVLADTGHFPHVESPGAVAEIIGDFLASTERRSTLITRC